jgi:hypothetical protein
MLKVATSLVGQLALAPRVGVTILPKETPPMSARCGCSWVGGLEVHLEVGECSLGES